MRAPREWGSTPRVSQASSAQRWCAAWPPDEPPGSNDIMTPLCALHHQLCVTCCSLGPNVLNITHFDLLVYISKLICRCAMITSLCGAQRTGGWGEPGSFTLQRLCALQGTESIGVYKATLASFFFFFLTRVHTASHSTCDDTFISEWFTDLLTYRHFLFFFKKKKIKH